MGNFDQNRYFVVNKYYSGICKDLHSGIILTRLIFIKSESSQNVIYRRYSQWQAEVGLTIKQAKRLIFKRLGVITTYTSLVNGATSLAFVVNESKINELESKIKGNPLELVSGQTEVIQK